MAPSQNRLYGGIEAGGTKFICIVAGDPDDIRAQVRFPTTTPEETLIRVIDFFKQHLASLAAVGIGCFGPVDLEPTSLTYGYITTTPKPGWANTNVVGTLQHALQLPVAFDTDVNAAAMGEFRWGAAQGLDPCLYLTIGTGIGAGGIYNGQPMHGLVHPESGHIRLPHDWAVDPFSGSCPYHGDCFEGLASGPAMRKRWGQPAEELPQDHPAWALEAEYIALACHNLICTCSPKKLVVGGGVMQSPWLLSQVQKRTRELLHGYIKSPAVEADIERYIVSPGLGGQAGVLGAVALAIKD